MVTLGTCFSFLLSSRPGNFVFAQDSLYGNCTTNGAPRESNVASQEKYIPGNYKITCFLMVATYTALHQKNHFIRLYMPFLGKLNSFVLFSMLTPFFG